jgi:hypothetical protein
LRCEDSNLIPKTTAKCFSPSYLSGFASTREQSRVLAYSRQRDRLAVVPWNESASVTRLHFSGSGRRFESGQKSSEEIKPANRKTMKAIRQTFVGLTVSFVLAFGLMLNLPAQDQKSPPDMPGNSLIAAPPQAKAEQKRAALL